MVFLKARPAGERRLDYRAFCVALCLLAEARYPTHHPDASQPVTSSSPFYAVRPLDADKGCDNWSC